MKRFLLFILLVTVGQASFWSGDKSGTVRIHPGEVIYVRFIQKGIKLTMAGVSQEKDDQAQLVLTLGKPDPKKAGTLAFKIENKFDRDLHYSAVMWSLTRKMHMEATVVPVVAKKLAIETFPPHVEELVLSEFVLEK